MKGTAVKRSIASVPLIALVALALVGCGPTPAPGGSPTDPRPTPSSTGTPVPVPAPTETLPPEALEPLDTVTRILLQTEGVYFCDEIACGVDGFYYDGSPDVAIAKLTAVFGSVPTSERFDDGGGQFSEYHSWGSFMVFFTTVDGVLFQRMGVSTNTATVEGVAVETEHGVTVGTPWSEVVALADSVTAFAGQQYEMDEASFDTIPTGTSGEFDAILALGNAGGGGGPVTSLIGPITTGEYSH